MTNIQEITALKLADELDGTVDIQIRARAAATELRRLQALNCELIACLKDVLSADGDLYAMDFDRYRATLARATGGQNEQ